MDGILANSHRFIHAVMSLEAGLSRSRPVPAREAFYPFAADTIRTLSLLTAALHGAPTTPADFPDLREDHNALIRTGEILQAASLRARKPGNRIASPTPWNTLAMEGCCGGPERCSLSTEVNTLLSP